MKKKFNDHAYIIIFLFAFFGLHTPIYGMNFAYFMNKLATTTFFATFYGHLGLSVYQSDNYVKNLPNADSEAVEFIHQTLQKYGYPESFYKNLTFKETNEDFFNYCTTIGMPISAQKLKDEYDTQDKFRQQGLTKRPNQFYLWQNDILHEASHASCHDTYKDIATSLVCPFVVHYLGKKISNFLQSNIPFLRNTSNIARGLATVPCVALKFATTIGVLHALRKYQEYRADYNIINRVTNPEALEDRAQQFNKACLDADKKYPWLKILRDEYQDEHPRDSVREAYFARAAQNLRKKQ